MEFQSLVSAKSAADAAVPKAKICLDRKHRRVDWNFVELNLNDIFTEYADEVDEQLDAESLHDILIENKASLEGDTPSERELMWMKRHYSKAGRISRQDFFDVMLTWYGYNIIKSVDKIPYQHYFPKDSDLSGGTVASTSKLNPRRVGTLLTKLNGEEPVSESEVLQVILDANILCNGDENETLQSEDFKLAVGRWYIHVNRSATGTLYRMTQEAHRCSRLFPLIFVEVSLSILGIIMGVYNSYKYNASAQAYEKCSMFNSIFYFLSVAGLVESMVLCSCLVCQPAPKDEPVFSLSVCAFLGTIAMQFAFTVLGLCFLIPLLHDITCLKGLEKVFSVILLLAPTLIPFCYVGCMTCAFSNNILGVGKKSLEQESLSNQIYEDIQKSTEKRKGRLLERFGELGNTGDIPVGQQV